MKEQALRLFVRSILIEAVTQQATPAPLDPQYIADLDAVSDGLQTCLKALEQAHQKAPDPVAKVVVAGVHSDLFNAAAQARGFIKKLKAGKPQG